MPESPTDPTRLGALPAATHVHRLLMLVMIAALLLLPSEHAGIAGLGRIAELFGVRESPWWWLASPAALTAVAASLLWLVAGRPWSPHRRALAAATACFVAAGLVPVATIPLTGGVPSLAVREAWLGHVAPALLVLVMLHMDPWRTRALWIASVAGWALFLMAALVAAAFSHTSAGWQSLDPAGRLVMWKFEMLDHTMLFTRWVGNANKSSNIILMGLVLAPTLLGLLDSRRAEPAPRHTDLARLAAAAYLTLAPLMLLLLFSRACLLLLPFALVGGGWWHAFRGAGARVAMATGAIALAALLVGVPTLRDALFRGAYPSGQVQGFLSTYVSEGGRLDQAQDVLEQLSIEANWLFGVGAGRYGLQAHGSADAGTHNYLLDTWLAGGLIGLLLTVTWLGICVVQSATRWREYQDRVGPVAIVILLLLMTREYSAAYLAALSMGGIVIMLVIAVATGAFASPPPDSLESRAPDGGRA